MDQTLATILEDREQWKTAAIRGREGLEQLAVRIAEIVGYTIEPGKSSHDALVEAVKMKVAELTTNFEAMRDLSEERGANIECMLKQDEQDGRAVTRFERVTNDAAPPSWHENPTFSQPMAISPDPVVA